MLRNKVKEANSSGNTTVNSISLKNTSGPPMRVEVNPKRDPDKGVSVSDLKDWMKQDSICLAHMRRNGRFIRKHFGGNSIEKRAREALQEESHSMDEFFETQELSFVESIKVDVKGKVKNEKRHFKRCSIYHLLISAS